MPNRVVHPPNPLDGPGILHDDLPPLAIGEFVYSAKQLYRARHMELYAYWQSVRGPGLALPARRDIDPVAIPDLLAGIWMADIVVQGGVMRFRGRLAGTAPARLFGKDTAGRFFEEVYNGDHLLHQQETYKAVATRALPHVSRFRFDRSPRAA